MTKAKSNKVIKMLMVCGASIAMLAPIAVSPLNSVMPANVTANASRVRRPRRRANNKEKRSAFKFEEYYMARLVKEARRRVQSKQKPKSKVRFERAVTIEHNYMKHNSDDLTTPMVQAHLSVLAKRVSNAGYAYSATEWSTSIKQVHIAKNKTRRYLHSKNPYIRRFAKRQMKRFNNQLQFSKHALSNSKRHISDY